MLKKLFLTFLVSTKRKSKSTLTVTMLSSNVTTVSPTSSSIHLPSGTSSFSWGSRSTRRPFSPSSSAEQTLLCVQAPMSHRCPYPCLLDALAKQHLRMVPKPNWGVNPQHPQAQVQLGTVFRDMQRTGQMLNPTRTPGVPFPFLCSTNLPVKEQHPHAFQPRTKQLT